MANGASSYHFDSKLIRRLSQEERQCLARLNIGSEKSHMKTILAKNPEFARAFIAYEANNIVGWSLARWFKPLHHRPVNSHISVFVHEAHRRKGLGRALLDRAVQFSLEHHLTPWVYAQNRNQFKFYQSCRMPVRMTNLPFIEPRL